METKYVQILVLASVFALQFLAEHLFPQRKELNVWKHERFNLSIGILNIALTFIPATFFSKFLYFLQTQELGLLHHTRFPFWLELSLTILIMDLWMYWWHRANHQLSFLWQFHRFHHKETQMNSTTALRFHVAELFLSYPGKAAVCFIFGISYLPLLIYEVLFFIAIIIHHSNIYVTQKVDSVYRMLFASPLMHRIHHSQVVEETDSNFGSLFSFWDRIFGSWTERPVSEIVFGLPKENE